jgi:hypothetical protein
MDRKLPFEDNDSTHQLFEENLIHKKLLVGAERATHILVFLKKSYIKFWILNTAPVESAGTAEKITQPLQHFT